MSQAIVVLKKCIYVLAKPDIRIRIRATVVRVRIPWAAIRAIVGGCKQQGLNYISLIFHFLNRAAFRFTTQAKPDTRTRNRATVVRVRKPWAAIRAIVGGCKQQGLVVAG